MEKRIPKSNRGWREIGDKRHYFRSKWEANYARYLQFLKSKSQILDWDFECKTFWFEGIKRGTVSYLPDFLVTKLDGTQEWHEVKGYMDAKSNTKIKRFAKYFPDQILRLVSKIWFTNNNKTMRALIRDWE